MDLPLPIGKVWGGASCFSATCGRFFAGSEIQFGGEWSGSRPLSVLWHLLSGGSQGLHRQRSQACEETGRENSAEVQLWPPSAWVLGDVQVLGAKLPAGAKERQTHLPQGKESEEHCAEDLQF